MQEFSRLLKYVNTSWISFDLSLVLFTASLKVANSINQKQLL